MKIIFSNYDSLNNPYYAGGGAIAIHSVAKRLAQRYEVVVLTGKYPGSHDEQIEGVQYKRIAFSVGNPKIDQIIFQFFLPWNCWWRKYDIWIESFTPPFSTGFLPWFAKKPVIGVAHLLAGKEMSQRYHLPFHIIEKFGLKQYKNIIVLSEFLKRQVLASGTKAAVAMIPNGLDSEVLNRMVDKKEEYILFLGRLDIFHKGLDVLLEAYREIVDSANYKLLIAGSGSIKETDKLKEIIKNLRLESKVALIGKVEGEKKWNLLEHAIITVIPSRVEGFAIVALEAMACKSPLVVSNIEGLRWIPGECAIKAEFLNAKSFSMAMQALLGDRELRRSMGEEGHKVARQYNWDNVNTQYNLLIETLII